MFRNRTLQRLVASILLASFGGGTIAPAFAQSTPQLADGASLQPFAKPGKGKPPGLDSNGIPTGKGWKQVSMPTVDLAAAPVATQPYGDALAALQDKVRSAKASLAAGRADGLAQANEARKLYGNLKLEEARVTQAFAATEAHLAAHGLGGEALARHQEAVAAFSSRKGELQQAMANLDAAANGQGALQQAVQQVADLLEKHPSQSGQHSRGKGHAWGHRDGKAKPPALSARDHERRFPRTVQLAAAGSLSGITLPDAILPATPQAADLAETPDVQLTPDIRALAASLGNNPVAIYNWVRNNVRYTVGYGAMQGAANTLRARQGNAFDTASLLVALYRAAGTPARYTYGTIEVPAERLRNWLGVDNTAAALSLLTQAGVPNRAVTQAGQTGAVQLEHVWVEAYVDYSPSRGGVNRAPAAWVPLDASFKQMDNKDGLDLRSTVSLNEAGTLDAARQGAVCTPDYAQNLNLAALQAGYTDYKSRLNNYLGQQGADLTVGDVLGRQAIAAKNYSILLGSLPYQTVAEGADLAALPPQLRAQFRLQLFADAAQQAQGQSVASFDASLPDVAHKRITLSFVPATAADAAVLDSYLPKAHADGSAIQPGELPLEVPGYLVRMKAEIRVDGAVVASGGSFVLGSELVANIGSFDPASGTWQDSSFYPHAGDYHAVAIDAQGVPSAQLDEVKARLSATQARLAAGQGASLARDEVSGDLLYHAALAYFATVDANGRVFQRAAGVAEQRLPSYGRAIAQAQPEMLFGIVNKVRFPGVALDIDRLDSVAASRNGGIAAAAYLRQANQRNAAYGQLVLARLFTSAQQPGQAASAIKALANAAAAGQKVFNITAANAASVLPQVDVSATARADLEGSVAAGSRALVAQAPLNIGNWNGQGLLLEDAAGNGSYTLSGEAGYATAALYLPNGMSWLALAQPLQAAASAVPAAQAAGPVNETLATLLGEGATTTRWSAYPGQADVASSLFRARLAAVQGNGACDSVAGIVAAGLDMTGGFDHGSVAGAPVITSVPVIAAGANLAYGYQVLASDPKGAALVYSLVDAPTGMSIAANGMISWARPVTGTFNVTVRADNGKAFAEQRYQLTVSQQLELDVNLQVTPAVVNLGETVTINVASSGGSGNVTRALTIDGQPVALTVEGRAQVTASAAGAHQIVATVTDQAGSKTRAGTYSVRDLADSTTPVAIISSPADDAEVTAPVNISGTASAASLAYYQLLLRPAGAGSWTEIGRGTSAVANGVLGKLDPTQLANGIYELVLNVVDANGRQQTQMITLDVYRDLKVGQFSLTFDDLNIEASGIPIRVSRTYDTRRKSDALDFGYGWSVDYQNMPVKKNMVFGLGWDVVAHASDLTLCLLPAGKRKINVTLPTGKVERFSARNRVDCAFVQIPQLDVVLAPLPGTTSRLEIINIPNVMVQGGQLYDMDNLETWNPKEFKLTTDDNYVYFLTEGVGITQVRDPNGNTLTYGKNGILHSNGQSVLFGRDAKQRITSVTDPAGKSIQYRYDANGDLSSVVARNGGESKYTYNRSHGLLDYTDPDGRLVSRFTYDADGRMVAAYDATGKAVEVVHDMANNQEVVKDRRGNVTTYTYDSAGNITQVVDALNNVSKFAYDAQGNETLAIDPLGGKTESSFDAISGKPLSVKDAAGNVATSEYDPGTRSILMKAVDRRGNTTTFGYGEYGMTVNQPGRQTAIGVDAQGNVRSYSYGGVGTSFVNDAKGNRISEKDAAGNERTYAYDANNYVIAENWNRVTPNRPGTVAESVRYQRDSEGRVVSETDSLGYVTQTEYNKGGLVTAVVDPAGRRMTYEYDERGKLAKSVYPDGTSVSQEYDAEGNVVSRTDQQGRVTRFQYDALNRLQRTVHADGTEVRIEYDAAGRIAAVVDARGNRRSNEYDALGQLVASTGPDGRVQRYTYDANGNQLTADEGDGKVERREYDALDRLVARTLPGGESQTVTWSASGAKTSQAGSGQSFTFAHDKLDRLVEARRTVAGEELVTRYAYDSVGNRTAIQDAAGHETQWEYDAGRRFTSRTLPDGKVERFSYDAVGNRTGHVSFNGLETKTVYDKMDRPVLVLRGDGSRIEYSYTASGALAATVVSGTTANGMVPGKTEYSYDARNRLVRKSNPDGSFIGYAYDENGNVVQRSTPSGTVSYQYDQANRMSRVTAANGDTTVYGYDQAGRLANISSANGVVATRTYDDNGRMKQVLHRRADGSILSGVRYTVNGSGLRTKVEVFDALSQVAAGVPANPAEWSEYAYDEGGRLTLEKITDRNGVLKKSVEYRYDKAGNRTGKTVTTAAGVASTTYSYDANDRLTGEKLVTESGSVVNTAFQWDANGNMLARVVGNSADYFSWNSDNRLVEVKRGSSPDTAVPVVRYGYDADGQRVSRVAQQPEGEVSTTYLVDTTFELPQVLRETRMAAGATAETQFVWGVGLAQQLQSGAARYYHADGLGSVRALSDARGEVAASHRYEAFGLADGETAATEDGYMYAGEFHDGQTGLQYHRARWYDSSAGRFASADTFEGWSERPASMHKYAYADNNPVSNLDPSGLATLMEMNATVSIAQEQRQTQTAFAGQQMKQFAAKLCSAAAAACKSANNAYDRVRKLTGGTANQAHHVFQNAVMEGLHLAYKRGLGFSIALLGGSHMRGSPHDIANTLQRMLKGKEARYVAYAALLGAGCRPSDATEIVVAAQNYNDIMGWK